MLLLSEVMIANPQVDDFESLVETLKAISKASDERFFSYGCQTRLYRYAG